MWLQEQLAKRHVLKRDWSAGSKYDNHSRLNKHNGKGPICPFNKHEILHFDNELDIHMNLRKL